jgi:transcriptional regulator with XRE-family HTH domain
MQRFGEKLRLLRERQQMSVRTLARTLGYTTHSYVSEIEAGKKLPSRHFITAVAQLFNVSYDQLLDDAQDLE